MQGLATTAGTVDVDGVLATDPEAGLEFEDEEEEEVDPDAGVDADAEVVLQLFFRAG